MYLHLRPPAIGTSKLLPSPFHTGPPEPLPPYLRSGFTGASLAHVDPVLGCTLDGITLGDDLPAAGHNFSIRDPFTITTLGVFFPLHKGYFAGIQSNRQMGGEPTAIALPNSEQFYLDNERGETYLIQVSWPLHWQYDRTSHRGELPIIYVVDGNALFLTATETAWRRAASSHFAGGGIIVAIGYPLAGKGKLYDARRRSLDLTPPTQSPVPGYGGADVFIDFIDNMVRPAVKARFTQVPSWREALYGHSYGGLFVQHVLFTRPRSFDCYMASSPSMWWNSRCILDGAKAFLEEDDASDEPLPSLMLFYGSFEQDPPQWNDEPLDHYEARKQVAADLRMRDNVLDLCEMLRDSTRLHTVSLNKHEGEEHTSVMACSMSRSLTVFFEDWPLSR